MALSRRAHPTRQVSPSRRVMKVDGRRARARPLGAAFALACLLGGCDAEPPLAAPERRAPPRASVCELDELSTHAGSSVALAARAIVLREGAGPRLVPLGGHGEAAPLQALSIPPRGLARRGAGWLALAATVDGPALLRIGAGASGRPVERIALGAGALTDGALVVRGDRAIATWLDGDGIAKVARIDLLRELATAAVVLEGGSGGAPLAVATQGGAVVAFAAPDAPLFDVRDTTATRRPAPGLVRALAPSASGAAVLHEAPDRTGLWLTVGGAAPLRATQPGARPASPSLAAIGGGLLLVYREEGDVFLQPLTARGEPSAPPLVAGTAGERASAPLVAVDDDRFWIAWDATGEAGSEVRVRTGRCE